jgi:hypothetical protein
MVPMHTFLYIIILAHVIKMNVCIRILFMKKTWLKMKVAYSILGSDKTTVMVGTGDIEYHLLYFSTGFVWTPVRRAHRNALIPIGFLAIPKSMSFRLCYEVILMEDFVH